MPTMKGKDILTSGQSMIAQRILDTEKAAAITARKPYNRTKAQILSVVSTKPIAINPIQKEPLTDAGGVVK